MFRHSERVTRIQGARLTLPGEYHVVEVDYMAIGGLRKTLALSESEAASLIDELQRALSDRPEEGRAERWEASFKAGAA